MFRATTFIVAAAVSVSVQPAAAQTAGSGAAQTAASTSVRIETEEALAQLLKKVDPTVPVEAVVAKVGGNVTVDIVIGLKGAVEAATVMAGPEELRKAAIDAVKLWTFKPFEKGGVPVRVRAVVYVAFPDPKADEKHRDGYARKSADAAAAAAAERRIMRMVGTIPCLCPPTTDLSEDELRKMAAAIPPHVRAWLIEAFDAQSLAAVYHAPLNPSQAFRIGVMSGLEKGAPPAPPGSGQWGFVPISGQHWVQVGAPGMGRPGTNMFSPDTPWPIIVNWDLNKGPLSDLETVALVSFIHLEGARTAKTAGAAPPRLRTDLQPWRIVQIKSEKDGFIVELQEALGERKQQHAFVKKAAVGWNVVWVE